MGLIGDIGKSVFNAVTSPVRAAWHAARTVVNAAHLVVSVASFGLLGNPKEQWNDLKDSVKGFAFAGFESLLTYGTFGGGLAALTAMKAGGFGLKVGWQALAKGSAAGMVENWARN